jgi:hypothetical protein
MDRGRMPHVAPCHVRGRERVHLSTDSAATTRLSRPPLIPSGAERMNGPLTRTLCRTVPLSSRTQASPSQTWRTFLDNQVGALAWVDFFTVPPPPFASFTSLSSLLGLCHAGTTAVCGLRGDFGSRRRCPDPPSTRARHSAHAHAQAPRKHTICRPLPCRSAVWPRPLSPSEGPSGAWMGQGPRLLSIAPLACRVARG